MIPPDRDPVREFVEQARELRRSEQPPAELFAATLSRLAREERARESFASMGRSQRLALSGALPGARRWLFRLTSPQLGLAFVLALAVIAGGRALRPTVMDGWHVEPAVAPGPEPATRHQEALAIRPDDFEPSTERAEAPRRAPEQRPGAAADTFTAPTGKGTGAGARSDSTSHTEQAPPPVLKIGSLPDLTEADAGVKPASKPAGPPKASCKPPWFIDAKGIKRLKVDCMSSRCEPPWYIDAEGIMRLKQECLSSAGETGGKKEGGKKKAAPQGSTKKPADNGVVWKSVERPPSCEPPWFIDAQGIKRLKPKCL